MVRHARRTEVSEELEHVPLATPVMRDVERMLLPSTSERTTAARRSVLGRFILTIMLERSGIVNTLLLYGVDKRIIRDMSSERATQSPANDYRSLDSVLDLMRQMALAAPPPPKSYVVSSYPSADTQAPPSIRA